MTDHVETVVIGGGAMGSAAVWQLARRGRDVLLLERFEPGHANGASHGPSRNFNVAYDRQPYLDLLRESLALWRELEAEADASLLELVGMVTHGGAGAFPEYEAQRAAGIPARLLSAEEAGQRWPGMRFETAVLFNEQAGRLDADAAVDVLQRAAVAHGASVRHRSRVVAIQPRTDGVLVSLEDGSAVEAATAIVTVGAWTQKLLGHLVALPALTVTQEQPAYFALRVADAVASSIWPGFNHRVRPGGDDGWHASSVYGMFTPGHGVKAGWHGSGPVTDPDARSFAAEPVQLDALRRYAEAWLPGVDPATAEPISCTYTTTPDADFIADRVGPLVIGAGFSGHGFKFTPAIGRALADLALGAPRSPAAFSLARFS